jgi:hypothetical protein
MELSVDGTNYPQWEEALTMKLIADFGAVGRFPETRQLLVRPVPVRDTYAALPDITAVMANKLYSDALNRYQKVIARIA